jgi:membrane protein DedA with SNARE-associated domain
MKPLPPDLKAVEPYLQMANPYIEHYGPWAVFIALLLEDFGLPVPGEAMLIAGAIFAALGDFHIEWVLLLGLLGAVIGDNMGYAIGYFGGRRVAVRYGRYIFLTESRLRRLEGFFDRHGGKVVAAARFIDGLRQFNGLIAGVSRMRWSRFLMFNILGAAIWVGFWGGAAYFFGSELGLMFRWFKRLEVYLLGGLALVIVFLVVRYLLRRNRGGRARHET